MYKLPRFLPCCVLLAGCLTLVSGCANNDGPGEGGSKKFLKLGTAPVGGAFAPMGDALAQVIAENKPEGFGKLSSTATKGTKENIRLLDQGELDFGMSNAAISYFAARGEAGWEKAYDIKAVMTLAPNVAMFVTLESSGIKTIADMKGKRVTIGPGGAGFEDFVGPILEAHGLSLDADAENGIKAQNAPPSQAVTLLGDGAIDAAFLGGAVPTPAISQACSTMDVHFIPYDDDAKQALIENYAFFSPYTIPQATYSDLQGDYEGLITGAVQVITSANQDEEIVYLFTKTIYENQEAVLKKHPVGKAIVAKNVVRNRGVDFHPGAIRYYKEAGIWPGSDGDAEKTGKTAD